MTTIPAEQASSSIIGALVLLVTSGLFIATLWKLFSKAGRPGWFALIPLYNLVVLCEIAGKPSWWAALLMVPLLNLLFLVLLSFGLANSFGKGVGFGLGLWALGPVFYPLLAFGDSVFRGTRPQYFAARA